MVNVNLGDALEQLQQKQRAVRMILGQINNEIELNRETISGVVAIFEQWDDEFEKIKKLNQ